MKRIGLLLLAAVPLVAACKVTSDGVVTNPAGNGSSKTHGTAPTPTIAHLGQTLNLKGEDNGESVAVKFTKWLDPAYSTDQFDSPDKGMRYVAAQFRITVTGTEGYSDSPTNGSEAIDSRGQQYDSGFADSIKGGALFGGSVKIAPGESALGFIVYEVPLHAKIVKVQFSEDSGFGQTGEWTV
jgi:hypothetical protein